ncbi:Hypothetical predicted protein [Paramuricea clavata]|uniref:Uncharacterized protein n=1 Tax=Paramuricea clavata TaxID=317549 RepID=A0A6S7HIG5_PARCT|nr:Hypothetical predicted protein [Paramuricea clavata]
MYDVHLSGKNKVEVYAIATDNLHSNHSNGGRCDQNKRVDTLCSLTFNDNLS